MNDTVGRISALYAQLRTRAAVTGEDRSVNLRGGARLAVRVREAPDGYRVTLTIARKKSKVGTTEEIVFKRDCNVPPTAQRIPTEDQQVRLVDAETWWLIAFRWTESR